ncbi:hypothetical protein P153DRAFT_364101 [Dothidotthia symphoricarpi CBS 119687]|uniref:Uncharacterized protein n=1 Tax=Dothidotthia symphoricarpi CBS 119687 TaxID=1392245 RepID=A0A6A6ANX0_9PLEO|nr:uncharacterized protein P153DRAFT_364101 [Dothidotthia symphoricarpi CBS 119687]KAF2132838.1 hypothetical protein P153DRAFT_364101 [Dothidotthia symphoricarpi CBS 119687]
MADITGQPLPRMPKLQYRSPPPAHGMSSSWSSRSIRNLEPRKYNTPGALPAATSRASSLDIRSSSETASSTSPSLASTSSSAGSSYESKSRPKKKPGLMSSVLGFLSLKEPSQLAFEQLAEQQRQQNGKATPTSAPTITSLSGQKLPASVPKVNSKWDGVPDKVKNRDSGSSQWSKDRSSIPSQNSRGSLSNSESTIPTSAGGTRNPPNSIASPMTSVTSVSAHQDNSSIPPAPATTIVPETSWYLPDGDEPIASGALPPKSLKEDSSQDPVAGQPHVQPELESDVGRPSDEYFDARSDSPASSIDSADTIVRDTAEAIFNELNHRPHQDFAGEDSPATRPPPDNVPSSHDFLFTPQPPLPQQQPPQIDHYTPTRPIQNFSRPMHSPPTTPLNPIRPSPYRKMPKTSGLPTLYELSLASDESLETVRGNSDAYSIAPSSIAPSELSVQWYDSPRERLGLGGRIRKNDVLPWEMMGSPGGKAKKSRLSMFGKGARV